jgi:hypothetical protein
MSKYLALEEKRRVARTRKPKGTSIEDPLTDA